MPTSLPSTEIKTKVAELLIDHHAAQINLDIPFRWSSGWLSPIYCDNRVLLSSPSVRREIACFLSNMIHERYGDRVSVVGVATGAIAMAMLVAEELKASFAYVRPKPKSHGKQSALEGKIDLDAPIVVVEDLISTGGSSISAIQQLLDVGAKDIRGLVANFTYGFEVSESNFTQVKIPFHTLTDYNTLIEVYAERSSLNDKQKKSLHAWRQNPSAWSNEK